MCLYSKGLKLFDAKKEGKTAGARTRLSRRPLNAISVWVCYAEVRCRCGPCRGENEGASDADRSGRSPQHGNMVATKHATGLSP